ncbi:MAG: pyruvate formate-lyase-activating protein [Parafannyhessea sp.]|uniref:pyruvate formate-lyase-activating protein n=1 Tax=Parafannyhessea sp. TaxID=2847324 RepID=UPI003F0AC734
MLGRVHSLESFGSADGPGVRFLVFLQGCAMRCRYCHNVDTWSMSGGTMMSADEILDRAERYRSYWGEDGGITVSGGEALLQIDFVEELFSKAKARGINTCLDTALQPFSPKAEYVEKFDRLMRSCDLVLADLKHIDPQGHRELTGHDNANILAALEHLDAIGEPVWVRHVLVPGITDDDALLERTAQFLSRLHNVERIEVLPYHTLGAYKWGELGMKYTLEGVEPPSAERVRNAERILRREG